MGCLDGAKLLRPTGDTPHGLEEFRGMKVAVDISYYFHVAVRVPAAVAQYHAAPPVPIDASYTWLRGIREAVLALSYLAAAKTLIVLHYPKPVCVRILRLVVAPCYALCPVAG